MSAQYASPERALSEAARCVARVLELGDVPTERAAVTREGLVPWATVLRMMEDIGIDDPVSPPGDHCELWLVTLENVGQERRVYVSLAFGAHGELCAAGMYAD